jgi:hypothetical protein
MRQVLRYPLRGKPHRGRPPKLDRPRDRGARAPSHLPDMSETRLFRDNRPHFHACTFISFMAFCWWPELTGVRLIAYNFFEHGCGLHTGRTEICICRPSGQQPPSARASPGPCVCMLEDTNTTQACSTGPLDASLHANWPDGDMHLPTFWAAASQRPRKPWAMRVYD